MGQGEYCPVYPLSIFLPELLPGLSIFVHLPPSFMPQRAQAMPMMEWWSPSCGLQTS